METFIALESMGQASLRESKEKKPNAKLTLSSLIFFLFL